MTPQEFEQHLHNLAKQYGEFYDKYAPTIAAKIAVSYFKKSFQTESWERVAWKEVKRREDSSNFKTISRGKRKGVVVAKNEWGRRKILTGETGDLGRSIEADKSRTGHGQAVVWTSPSAFAKSGKIHAAVHNEGLKAGRGSGFTMPKRQFMGNSPTLNKLIIEELERKLNNLMNK